MKILEINKFYFAKGGADKHFLDLVKLLESKGNEVAVFSMQNSNNLSSAWSQYFVSNVGYSSEYSLAQKIKGIFRMFYSLEAKRKINKLLDDFQPDVVHIHNIYHQLSPCILFEIKKRKIPIVMTVHDYKLINPNYNLFNRGKSYARCKNGKYYQCFLDRCVKNSYAKSFLAMLEMYWHGKILKTYEKNVDLFVSPSEFTKNILIEWGIDKDKIAVLPHFIISNQEEAATEVKDSSTKEKYALYFGRISQEKGAENLIDIFENAEGIKLYLAGKIEDGMKIEKSKNVEYLGYFGQDKLKEFIKNSEFVVSGSKLPETFGLIALEATAQGKPFIGFKSGAYPEIIKNGINGYLAENNQEMSELIRKISDGEMAFNCEKIKEESDEKYAKDAYCGKLIAAFDKTRQIC